MSESVHVDDLPVSRLKTVRLSLRRGLWVPLLAWLLLVMIPLIPLFLASFWLIGESGFHAVQIGVIDEVYIHGSELKCKEDRPNRECTLVINGSLLEISAPLLDEFGSCEVRYGGKIYTCRPTKVTGENQTYPPEAKNGVLIIGEELENLILADQASWRNWRSTFLGVGRENTIITRQFSWAIISFILAFFVLPPFLNGPPQEDTQKHRISRFIFNFVALIAGLPVLLFGVLTVLIAFGFVL